MEDLDRNANHEPAPGELPPARKSKAWLFLALVPVALLVVKPDSVQAAWAEISRIIELRSDPLPASPPRLSDHQIEELTSLAPQQQAELLVERAVNHYEGAIELIDKNVESWRGKLELRPQFSGLLLTAINSNDLRVRAAALEVEIAAASLVKSSETVETLVRRLQDEPAARPWGLWMLGALGNRGAAPERVFSTLLDYAHDRDAETRNWAMEGLGNLGTAETIRPLLDAFHNDASPVVRERAACHLAQSGMLTKDLRLSAVPELLAYTDDPSLDPQTRGWVFQALRDITGATIGADPAAWRAWWAEHGK